jgi:hypothetical protein
MERAVWKVARFIAAQLWEMDNIDFYPDCDLAWLLRQDNIATSVNLFGCGSLCTITENGLVLLKAIVQAIRPMLCIMLILFWIGVEIQRKHGATDLDFICNAINGGGT